MSEPNNRGDKFHLEAAQGWVGLGDLVSAASELEEIAPEFRAHPAVLLVRCDIYVAAEKWPELLAVAESLVKLAPNEQQSWIHRSMALHKLNRIQEAFDMLLPARERFPKSWLVPYTLTIYSGQLGQIKAAEDWFKKAMALNEHHVKRIAIDDPELEPLWTGMQGTTWKRAE